MKFKDLYAFNVYWSPSTVLKITIYDEINGSRCFEDSARVIYNKFGDYYVKSLDKDAVILTR